MENRQVFVGISIDELSNVIRNEVQSVMNELIPKSQSKVINPPEADLINAKEAQKILNCSFGTLVNYRKSGKLQARRFGRKLFFSKSEILKSLENKFGVI
ncbi:MAG: helix-turn-helix domain-containing protein [Candidatus Kapabacteria bacterium]|nr:helix-turn-helix domain-containing protein [Candidatus Kapabacteria bacterium]